MHRSGSLSTIRGPRAAGEKGAVPSGWTGGPPPGAGSASRSRARGLPPSAVSSRRSASGAESPTHGIQHERQRLGQGIGQGGPGGGPVAASPELAGEPGAIQAVPRPDAQLDPASSLLDEQEADVD